MLKNLLPLLVLICFTATAQTTPIPDANFEQFLVDEGIDTNGVNGNILNADATAVTNLNVNRNDITDFTGLEAFVNLVSLDAGTNEFPTLPLNTLTDLEVLEFGTNRSLASLDVLQNLALRVLDIRSSISPDPPITTLNLSNNLNLEKLSAITFANITTLNFPVTSTLVDIDIANMSVPTVDLSQLEGDLDFRIIGSRVDVNIIYPNKKDALKRLELSSIDFPNVDVSEMIGLERFQLSSTFTETIVLPTTNTLTNISISVHELNAPISFASVPQLQSLSITTKWDAGDLKVDISQNPELTSLTLTNNNMLSVDVTNNTKLTTFRVYNNNLTALDVTQNLVLNRLEAYQNQLPSIDLSQNIDLQWLNLSQNQLPSLNVTNNPDLRSINIANNLFTGTGLDLTQNIELNTLNAGFNQIESLDITQNPEIDFLTLNDNLFTGTDILDQFYVHYQNRTNMRVNLNVENNMLSGRIPDFFSPFPLAQQTRRNEILFSGNAFEFGDFENEHLDYVSLLSTMTLGASPDFIFRNYSYAPHAKVNAIESPTRNAGESISLTTTVRGEQNHYKWFKDGVEITNAPDAPEYTITDLNTCDAGVYHAEITSDLVPFENGDAPGTNGRNLLLVRNDITLTVNATKDCVTLDMPLTNVPINSGIQWNDNPGACGYKISVGTSSGATDLVNDLDVGEVTVYNHSTDFASNQDIFITITPYFDDGDFSCTEQSFRTNTSSTLPDCTFISFPENSDTNVASDISQIVWNPANGADSYEVTITSPSGSNNGTTTVTDTFITLNDVFDAGETVSVSIVPSNDVGAETSCAIPAETFTIASTSVVVNTTGAFITTWETTLANETITIPTFSGETYDYEVVWGDGDTTTGEIGDATHTYATPGRYTVSITGTFPRIYFNNGGVRTKIMTIEQWGTNEWTSMERAFYGCTNLNITNATIDNPVLSNVSDMRSMFGGCLDFNGDITNWDVSNVTNMASAFNGARSFNQDISSWNVSNVTRTDQMFQRAEAFNQDIGNWSVNNVRNMDSMFSLAVSFDQNLELWDVSDVTDMEDIFDSVTLSTSNYDALLIGWNSQTLQPNITFSGGNSQYCEGASARANMIASDTWAITDGGLAGPTVDDLVPQNEANSFTFPVITGTQLTGSEAYYTDPNGTGTRYEAGDIIDFSDFPSYPVTLYIYDGAGSCTSEESFTLTLTSGTTVPSCTSLTNPSTTNAPIGTTEMTWNAVANATGYRITITGTANNDITDEEVTTNSYPFPNAFVNGETATVTIVPFNGTVNAAGCADETFTIEAAAPTVPVCTSLTSPTATDVPIRTTEMTWNTITDATGYRITITGTANNNTTDEEVTTNSYTFPNAFVNGETATVTIVPFNETVNATGCTAETFTIEAEASTSIGCASLISPENESTEVSINTSISWGEVPNAEGYRISVGTSAGATDIINNEDVSILTSYSFAENLVEGTTYYVTITPYNTVEGDALNCSEYSFTTETEESEQEEEEETIASEYGFSPDGDNINEFWEVTGIENHPENTVTIYNRWGDEVFIIENYDNNSRVFRGTANRKTKMGAGELPSGTYFFNIRIDGEHNLKKTKGFLVLKR